RQLLKKNKLRVLAVIGNWSLWTFVTILIFGQFLGSIWTTVNSVQHVQFGQSPDRGLYQVAGESDEPYTDRSFVCSLHGRIFKPRSVQKAIKVSSTAGVSASDSRIDGYRMVSRNQFEFGLEAYRMYSNVCDIVAAKLDTIVHICTALGYNVTIDKLRIVPDVNSKDMISLLNTLPVIILPYYDNSQFSRCAIPGSDGSACIFHLIDTPHREAYSIVRVMSRVAREKTTIELLGRPGGTWKHGWYEDLDGGKWHSDVVASNVTSSPDFHARDFDLQTSQEIVCSASTKDCGVQSMTQTWGSQLLLTENEVSSTSIVTLNGFHFGLFLYEGMIERVVESVYDLRIFISNISLVWLLFRWMVALIALLNGYRQGVSDLDAANIGVLSCCRGFHFLPIVLLPRLKMYLAIFSTIGCQFEGAQRALSETRTVMYPGIAELVLFSYSILNLLAKVLGRQVSDALFAPTLLFYCLMHTLRQDLAESGWLEYQGRVTTIVMSSEFAALSVVDFFQSDMMLRLNGNIKSLLWIKVAVYAASILLPLLWSRRQQLVDDDTQVTQLERALGLRLDASGGLTSELFRTYALNRGKDSNSR
uniref:Uncharacterized protein n=1 Tax=Globisporangium ultimum (strain ATCC 200006 / CBS 805.95 / DAOM BR144) TaxID=431595 RepID=K3WCH5_GLOUD